jgi:hypothetical protein
LSIRHPTKKARQSLSTILRLPYYQSDEDWEWQVADEKRFEEFLSLYEHGRLSDDERFSLMEIIIQSVEDTELEDAFRLRLVQIERLLVDGFTLHESTISYWHENPLNPLSESEQNWLVSPLMSDILSRCGKHAS